LQSSFSSYREAEIAIHTTNFTFSQDLNTTKSSWVRGAKYFSCDKKTGYFILKTDRGNYIHMDMPISIWYDFKNSNSFGNFYNTNIRNQYHLELTSKP
jgi:hypothetical protein